MARQQQAVVVALVLLATVGLAFAADAPAAAVKPGLPTFSGVPSSGPVSADNNQVGTVGGDAAAPSPGGDDAAVAGSVGGPVSESTFGDVAAETPKPSAATAGHLSAGAAVAAAVAASAWF